MDIWKPSRYCPMDPFGQLNISSLMRLYYLPMILAEILQPVEVGSWSHYLQGFNKSVTLQGTNISPQNGILKMIFLFPRWDMLIPWRVYIQKVVKKPDFLPSSRHHHGCLWRTATFHLKSSRNWLLVEAMWPSFSWNQGEITSKVKFQENHPKNSKSQKDSQNNILIISYHQNQSKIT